MPILSGQKTEPLTESGWIRCAALGRVQVQKCESGAGKQAEEEQRTAAPGDWTALRNLHRYFDQTGDNIEYAAKGLKQKADHDHNRAKQGAANRDQRQVRRVNVLQ